MPDRGVAILVDLPATLFKDGLSWGLLGILALVAFAAGRVDAVVGGIGFYDGMLGPGTGTFLVISLVSVLGYNFLEASAKAKIFKVATNLGALLLFVPRGAVLWGLDAVLAVANMASSS